MCSGAQLIHVVHLPSCDFLFVVYVSSSVIFLKHKITTHEEFTQIFKFFLLDSTFVSSLYMYITMRTRLYWLNGLCSGRYMFICRWYSSPVQFSFIMGERESRTSRSEECVRKRRNSENVSLCTAAVNLQNLQYKLVTRRGERQLTFLSSLYTCELSLIFTQYYYFNLIILYTIILFLNILSSIASPFMHSPW